MTDENKSYRVNDRRHFNADGESVATQPPAPSEETVSSDPQPVTADDAAPATEPPEPPADFIGLVVSLGTQAGMLLTGGEGRAPDLRGARWLISILEMLGEKTEGRRTPEESETLESLLYELRMAYVGRTRTGGT
jgi:hypothetical protein